MLTHTSVAMNEGQGDSNWYQNAEFSDFYHHIKYQTNQSVNVQVQASVKGLFVCFAFVCF